MKYKLLFLLLTIVLAVFPLFNNLTHAQQDNPVLVPDIQTLPVFDGNGNDLCWQNIPWQNIDQVWIPYNNPMVSADDYSGHYKIAWSSLTNLLYFLIEIHDDEFVDNYGTSAGGNLWDNDITEIFIDEDASGGLHMYDRTNPYQNAENAFAYHMFSTYPADGEVSNNLFVYDMASTGTPNNVSHIPDYTIAKTGNSCVREFSLIVYNDTYTESNKDAARVQLTQDKVIGLSIAYCDNDDPDGVRDNMFGSVWEPSPGNLHWQNADYFGRVKLVTNPTSVTNQRTDNSSSVRIFPNPASLHANVQIDNTYLGEISLRLYNILGQEISTVTLNKENRILIYNFNFNSISPGIYLFETQMGNSIKCEKLIISRR